MSVCDLTPAETDEDAGREKILRVLRERRSVRAYQDREVPRATIDAILECARWAPSGANMQPWEVHAITGGARKRLVDRLTDAVAGGAPEHADYPYYPSEWVEPFKSRRMAAGMAIYNTPGMPRGPKARAEHRLKIFRFFEAPVVLLCFLSRGLATGSWLDHGMFVQNIMIAARAFGLETCPQTSVADFPDIAREALGVPPDRILVCGVSLGFADWDNPINHAERARVDVSEFLTHHA